MSQLLVDKSYGRIIAPLPPSRLPADASPPVAARRPSWVSPPPAAAASQRLTFVPPARPSVAASERAAKLYDAVEPSNQYMSMHGQGWKLTPTTPHSTATPAAKATHEIRLTSRAADVAKVLALAEGGRVTLGRASSSRNGDVSTDDGWIKCPVMSKSHAEIQVRNGIVYVVDVGSLHGTQVNGLTLSSFVEKAIKDGDRLTLGKQVVKAGVKSDALQLDVSIRSTASRTAVAPLTPPTPEKALQSAPSAAQDDTTSVGGSSAAGSDESVHSPWRGRYGLPVEAAEGDLELVLDRCEQPDYVKQNRELLAELDLMLISGEQPDYGEKSRELLVKIDLMLDGGELPDCAETGRELLAELAASMLHRNEQPDYVEKSHKLLAKLAALMLGDKASHQALASMDIDDESSVASDVASDGSCVSENDDDDDENMRDSSAARHEPELIWRQAEEEDRQDALRALRAKREQRKVSLSQSQQASASPARETSPLFDTSSAIWADGDGGVSDHSNGMPSSGAALGPGAGAAFMDALFQTLNRDGFFRTPLGARSDDGRPLDGVGDGEHAESESEAGSDAVSEEEQEDDDDSEKSQSRSVSEAPEPPKLLQARAAPSLVKVEQGLEASVPPSPAAEPAAVPADVKVTLAAPFSGTVHAEVNQSADRGLKRQRDANDDEGAAVVASVAEDAPAATKTASVQVSPPAQVSTATSTASEPVVDAAPPVSATSSDDVDGEKTAPSSTGADELAPVAAAPDASPSGDAAVAEPVAPEPEPAVDQAMTDASESPVETVLAPAAVEPTAPANEVAAGRPAKRARVGTFILGALAGSVLSIGALASYGAGDL